MMTMGLRIEAIFIIHKIPRKHFKTSDWITNDNLSDPIILQLSKKLAKKLLCSKSREAEFETKKEAERTHLVMLLDHR